MANEIEIEVDPLNDHECMPQLIKLIEFMRGKTKFNIFHNLYFFTTFKEISLYNLYLFFFHRGENLRRGRRSEVARCVDIYILRNLTKRFLVLGPPQLSGPVRSYNLSPPGSNLEHSILGSNGKYKVVERRSLYNLFKFYFFRLDGSDPEKASRR